MRLVLPVCALVVAACAADPIDYGDPVDDPELPPRGMAAIEPWLAAGHHNAWRCEPVTRPARPGSPHGGARVCSNALLSGADAAALPIGVVSVKEIYDDGGALLGHAVSRKMGEGDWYWYEFHSKRLFVDGHNTGSCPDCHVSASAEQTFTIVR
jgi:hypothetical protein